MTNPLGDLIFHQFQDNESKTFTYLLADPNSGSAVIIDPVKENVPEYLYILDEFNLNLHYVLDTHVHADHITGAFDLAHATGALVGLSRRATAVNVTVSLRERSRIAVGSRHWLSVVETPGHTDNSVCFVLNDGIAVFTGDTLLIGGCGRADFQNGNASHLYDSIKEKLYTLPKTCLVYPGHDYNGRHVSSINEERSLNKRLTAHTDRTRFLEIMSALNLPEPKKLRESLTANMRSGE